jgi:hypothetical protein
LRGKEHPCSPPREFDMTKVTDVVRFLECHSWKVIASTEPYGEQKTTFTRFQCTKCKAEWVSLASNPRPKVKLPV